MGRELPFSYKKLSGLVSTITRTEAYIKGLQKMSERFWKLQYMRQLGNDAKFPAVVVEKEASLS
jgi:hypothetical protein